MDQTERNNMRATRAKDLARLSCLLLLGACNDGFLGYSAEPRCVGEKTRCEAPEEPSYRSLRVAEFEDTKYLHTEELSALTPVEVASAPCLSSRFIGGQGSDVWVICNEYGETEIRVQQYDGEKLLSDFLLLPPPALKGKKKASSVQFLRSGSTADGPYLGLSWDYDCADPDRYVCHLPEVVHLTQDASKEPKRVSFQADGPYTFDDLDYVLVNDQGEIFWLGRENGNVSLGRVDEKGKVLWIQQGFPEGFSPEWYLFPEPLTFANGKVTVLGTLENGGFVTLEADPATGNLSGSRLYDNAARAAISHDGNGALVFAYSDVRGDLHWLRADKREVQETVLVRQDYTLLHPNSLEVDRKGAHYLATVTGPIDGPMLTLCRMNKKRSAACYLAPEAWVGETFWPEEWLEILPPEWTRGGLHDYNTGSAFATVSADGSVYTLGKDQSLLRYRFPESDAK